MEHIADILKQQNRISSSRENTDTSSSADDEPTVCPECGGAGFVHPVKADGRPDYSAAVPCLCTQKVEAEKRQGQLEQYSNLGALSSLTFDQISSFGKSGEQRNQELFQRAFDAAVDFAAEPQGWLILTGPSGSGKTHLAAAIANMQLQRGAPAIFITAADLLDHLRAAFAPGSELSYDRLFDRVRNAPVLIIDDLGQQSGTPWAQEKLDQLLNHRYNNRLPTVITGELPADSLEERWHNRFSDESLCRQYILETREKVLDGDWGKNLEIAFKVAGSDETENIGFPENRYGLALNQTLWEGIILSLAYLHDEFHQDDINGSDERDVMLIQLGVEF